MWNLIPSMDVLLQGLMSAFTLPSFETHREIFLGWVMCFGRRTEFRVFETINGARVSRRTRHPFDRFYNFFSRSAWTVQGLASQVAVNVVTQLNRTGELLLAVDGTLLHKSSTGVFGVGWFHDPVASTKKRAATALGNKWVVVGLVVTIPGVQRKFCLPIHAMLQLPGGKHSEPELARQMLEDIQSWFPDRKITLVGDGGFSSKKLLRDLGPAVRYVGLMRGDAELYDPVVPPRPKSKSGPKPKRGPRLPSPRQAAKKADRSRSAKSKWRWTNITVQAYGQERRFEVCCYEALWSKVFGTRPIQVVMCRALDQGYDEIYLYTTDLNASPAWVVATYGSRNTIETTFKNSKQVLEIQKPQHFCEASIKKLAPWVWFTQTIVSLWYLSDGRKLPEARAARNQLGEWESEFSFRHMFRLLRRVTLRQTINATSHTKRDLYQLIGELESYLYLAA